MSVSASTINPTYSRLWEALILTGLLTAFGYYSQQQGPWAMVLLGLSALIMSRQFSGREMISRQLGLQWKGQRMFRALGMGLAGALVAIILFRRSADMPFIWDQKLTAFAWVAAAIGVTEELVFRGYLQSRLSPYGAAFSIVFATVAHTAYKVALLFPYPFLDLGSIALWTVGAGLFIGWLRHYSGSIYPSLVNHALFDALAYGGLAAAPWWVW